MHAKHFIFMALHFTDGGRLPYESGEVARRLVLGRNYKFKILVSLGVFRTESKCSYSSGYLLRLYAKKSQKPRHSLLMVEIDLA